MSAGFAVILFLLGVVSTLIASEVMVRGVSWLGIRLDLSGGLVGLLAALGADIPEISSAVSAVTLGAKDVGVGVIIGSNLFNLAALLGLAAVTVGRLRFRRLVPLIDGAVGLVVLILIAGLASGILGRVLVVVFLALAVGSYVLVLSTAPARLLRLPLPKSVRRSLTWLAVQIRVAPERPRELEASSWRPAWMIVPSLIAIGAGSYAMVISALALSDRWNVPHRFVGTVVLAALTGLPNAYSAIRLAQQEHGSAVISTTFNSNTINLIAGLGLPALILGRGFVNGSAAADLWWLLAMTIGTIVLAVLRPVMTRLRGLLIAAYIAYLGFQMFKGWT